MNARSPIIDIGHLLTIIIAKKTPRFNRQLRDTILQNRMSQTQYLKMLEREIQKINKKIDFKILRGEEYWKEARDHRILLKKVRYNHRQNFWRSFSNILFRLPVSTLIRGARA